MGEKLLWQFHTSHTDMSTPSGGRGTVPSLDLFHSVRKPFSEVPSRHPLMSILARTGWFWAPNRDYQGEETNRLPGGGAPPPTEGSGNVQGCPWFTKWLNAICSTWNPGYRNKKCVIFRAVLWDEESSHPDANVSSAEKPRSPNRTCFWVTRKGMDTELVRTLATEKNGGVATESAINSPLLPVPAQCLMNTSEFRTSV